MNRDQALEVIRNLEARAAGTTFPAEAESCQEKIKRLRARFGFGDEDLRSPEPEPPTRPQGPPPDGTVVGHDPFGRPIVIYQGRPYVVVQQPVVVNTGTGTSWYGPGGGRVTVTIRF